MSLPALASGRLPRIIVVLALVAGAVWAGWTIRLETELLALFPRELPSVRGLDRFQRQFVSDREVILVLDDTLPGASRDAVFQKLRPALAALPGVESVEATGGEWLKAAPQLAAWAIWNLEPERFTRVVAALEPGPVRARLDELPSVLAGPLDPEELARRRFDPLGLLDVLAEQQGDSPFQWTERPATSLTVTATRPLITFDECEAFSTAIHAAVRRTLPGETRLLLTGRPAFTAEISTEMRRDMRLMIVVATVLVSAAFWAFYRSLRPLGWILLAQFLALGVGIIAARLGIGSLNVISMGFACILLGISMDYSILVYHHFASDLRDDGAVWARLCRGIRFSAVTTAAAFLVLAFSSLPGLRQLAVLVAAGLLASACFATWLLPAAWADRPRKPPPFLKRMSGAMARAMARRGRALLALATVFGLIATAWLWRDPAALYAPDLERLKPTETAAFRGQQILARNDPSWRDAIYLVEAPNWDAVRQATDDLAVRVTGGRRSPQSAFLPATAHQRENRARWKDDITPRLRLAFDSRGLGSEWSGPTLALTETLDRAAAGADDAFAAVSPLLAKLYREDPDRCRAIVRLRGAAEHPAPPGGLALAAAEVLPVSWVTLKDELNQIALADLRRLSVWVLAAIFVLCAVAQRSLRLVLLNFAALGLSFLLFGALLVVTGVALSPLSLLCVPLLIGLCIDYSLHVLMALEHERDYGHLYAQIGVPILLTGLASCIGFGVPMLTSQPALQNFGLVMDLGIIAAVGACLFLLPVLARLPTQSRGRSGQSPGESC
ncbi:MAG: MMPL family transporter [Gammaproteobacteria bacterium]|nr:MMPL family transporter [Gammaproteobacteria bacterium]